MKKCFNFFKLISKTLDRYNSYQDFENTFWKIFLKQNLATPLLSGKSINKFLNNICGALEYLIARLLASTTYVRGVHLG